MKFDINGLMYDICNWALNITFVMFLWSLNKTYCVAIVGLFVLRFIAEMIYRNAIMKESEAARSKILEMVRKQAENDGIVLRQEELTAEEPLELEGIIQDHNNVIVDITPKDDKKVH